MTVDRVERKLAAILAADVAGYSRLMGSDEEGTLASLTGHRRELIDPCLAKHRGRIVKTTGDGLLAEFGSVVDAVRCAVEIQAGMAQRNAGLPEDKRLDLRIGINVGDIVEQDGDIFGDGVNIAARLERIAELGTICVSQRVYEDVEGKVGVAFEYLGEQALKNITRPVRVYRLRAPTGGGVESKPILSFSDKPSIAVLPFDNLSGDPQQLYFSDGITEDIITELSRFHQLIVIARHSSFQYRDKAADVIRIGRELQTQYVVEGSIRRGGDRIRITAQLIDAASGSHLWAERYDRDFADLFDLQDEVSKMIASALAVRLEVEDLARAKRKPPDTMRAYDYWLRGKKYLDLWTPEANAEARRMFDRALESDPDYARAHAGLSFTHEWAAFYSAWDREARSSHDDAYRHAKRAVALDDTDPLPHVTLGWLHHQRREFEQAQKHFARAAAINPNDADTMINRAMVLALEGRSEAALEMAQGAVRLNPRHPDWYFAYLGGCLFRARRYTEAAATFENAPDAVPEARAILAAACVLSDRSNDGRRHMIEFIRRFPLHWTGQPSVRSFTATVFALKQPDDADRFSDALREAGMPE